MNGDIWWDALELLNLQISQDPLSLLEVTQSSLLRVLPWRQCRDLSSAKHMPLPLTQRLSHIELNSKGSGSRRELKVSWSRVYWYWSILQKYRIFTHWQELNILLGFSCLKKKWLSLNVVRMPWLLWLMAQRRDQKLRKVGMLEWIYWIYHVTLENPLDEGVTRGPKDILFKKKK